MALPVKSGVVPNAVQRRTTPADPYIYHHKWLFVDDDYQGFDVEESRIRSKRWISLGDVDRSRIGRKRYWEQNVVPRLDGSKTANDIPICDGLAVAPPTPGSRWVRSEEAGRAFEYLVAKAKEGRS